MYLGFKTTIYKRNFFWNFLCGASYRKAPTVDNRVNKLSKSTFSKIGDFFKSIGRGFCNWSLRHSPAVVGDRNREKFKYRTLQKNIKAEIGIGNYVNSTCL